MFGRRRSQPVLQNDDFVLPFVLVNQYNTFSNLVIPFDHTKAQMKDVHSRRSYVNRLYIFKDPSFIYSSSYSNEQQL